MFGLRCLPTMFSANSNKFTCNVQRTSLGCHNEVLKVNCKSNRKHLDHKELRPLEYCEFFTRYQKLYHEVVLAESMKRFMSTDETNWYQQTCNSGTSTVPIFNIETLFYHLMQLRTQDPINSFSYDSDWWFYFFIYILVVRLVPFIQILNCLQKNF